MIEYDCYIKTKNKENTFSRSFCFILKKALIISVCCSQICSRMVLKWNPGSQMRATRWPHTVPLSADLRCHLVFTSAESLIYWQRWSL